MTTVTEIAPDTYRITTFIAPADLQYSQFLLLDREPLLYHAGLSHTFHRVEIALAEVFDPSTLRWVGCSHFEADEVGALDEWLRLAPQAEPVGGTCAALVNVDDVAQRRARRLADGEVIETGSHRLRYFATPHLPHGWDAGHLYDETTGVLFCSDLLHQNGDVEPVTRESVVERMRAVLLAQRGTPFDHYFAWTPQARAAVERLAALEPVTCATMHGSVFVGDSAAELRAMAAMIDEVYGAEPAGHDSAAGGRH